MTRKYLLYISKSWIYLQLKPFMYFDKQAPSAEQKIINFLFAPLQLLLICFAPNNHNGSKEGWFSIVPRIIWHLIFVLMSDNSARHVQVRSTKMSTIRFYKRYFKLDLYIYLTNEIKMLQCITTVIFPLSFLSLFRTFFHSTPKANVMGNSNLINFFLF